MCPTIRSFLAVCGLSAAWLLVASFAPAATLNYNFDDGTAQGWTNVLTSASGPTQFTVTNLTDPPNGNYPNAQSPSFYVVPQVPNFNCCPQDNPHSTLVFRSPVFQPSSTSDITFFLTGGTGDLAGPAGNFASLPGSSIDGGGFEGMALRRVSDGAYLLAARKANNSANYEQLGFSSTTINANGLAGVPMTLDLIDYKHGGWGWVGIDSVTITNIVPEPTSLALAASALVLAMFFRRRAK